jgi:hypothetical protein
MYRRRIVCQTSQAIPGNPTSTNKRFEQGSGALQSDSRRAQDVHLLGRITIYVDR